ncbi:hypothetical protein ACEUZ9_000297 [Paracoccus litorisediminis]|uniref:hypothetical protein n=1 Tax=Paracoccus litorisediminis TaxID=2006130 RepID=UPI0037320DC1
MSDLKDKKCMFGRLLNRLLCRKDETQTVETNAFGVPIQGSSNSVPNPARLSVPNDDIDMKVKGAGEPSLASSITGIVVEIDPSAGEDLWVASIPAGDLTPFALLDHPNPTRAKDLASAPRNWGLDERFSIWIQPIRQGRQVTGWKSLAVLYEQDLDGNLLARKPCIIRQDGTVVPTSSLADAMRQAVVAVLGMDVGTTPIDLMTPCQPLTAFGNTLIESEILKGGAWAQFEEVVEGRPMDFHTLGTMAQGWPHTAFERFGV